MVPFINDVTALGGGGIKDFVTTVLKLITKKHNDGGGGVESYPKTAWRHLWTALMQKTHKFRHKTCYYKIVEFCWIDPPLPGDDDEEEGEEGEEAEEKMPTCGDYIMHFLTLFWKVLFAIIPPAGKPNRILA
jgi:hypothetical protein